MWSFIENEVNFGFVLSTFFLTWDIDKNRSKFGHFTVKRIKISLKDFIYVFLERGEGREKERGRNINVWLPLVCPLLGTWPATQACALTGNQTHDPVVRRPVLNPLSHTSQGKICWSFKENGFLNRNKLRMKLKVIFQ